MIEDALKSSRTIHRLILAVNAAAVVFAFSIERPPQFVKQLEQLRAFKSIDFSAYEEFVQQQALLAAESDLLLFADQLGDSLDESGMMIFGLEKIANAFRQPSHVGRVIVHDSVLVAGDSAEIKGLDLMGTEYITSRNPQVLVPVDENLIESIVKFVKAEGRTGMRVDNVQFEFTGVDFTIQSFLADDETAFTELYFELVPPQGAAPVYTGSVQCEVRQIPDASLKEWLLSQPEVDVVFEPTGDGVTVFPGLRPFAEGLSELTVGAAINQAQNNIRESSPETQSVTLLGTSVPGRLVVIAAPLTSTLLLLYLAGHLRHLISLARAHQDQFRQFAWISLKHRWGPLETGATLVLLPVAANVILAARLWSFGTPKASLLAVTLVCGIIGVVATRELSTLRRLIADSGEEPQRT